MVYGAWCMVHGALQGMVTRPCVDLRHSTRRSEVLVRDEETAVIFIDG